jgi:hypothetical protein
MITPDKAYNLTFGNHIYIFNFCCGTAELGTFNLEEVASESDPKTIEQYKTELLAIMDRRTVSSLVATTVYAPENFRWNEINLHLEAIGWERLKTYINKNSKNTVILWHYSRD